MNLICETEYYGAMAALGAGEARPHARLLQARQEIRQKACARGQRKAVSRTWMTLVHEAYERFDITSDADIESVIAVGEAMRLETKGDWLMGQGQWAPAYAASDEELTAIRSIEPGHEVAVYARVDPVKTCMGELTPWSFYKPELPPEGEIAILYGILPTSDMLLVSLRSGVVWPRVGVMLQHREDGPAIEYEDPDRCEYYLTGHQHDVSRLPAWEAWRLGRVPHKPESSRTPRRAGI